MSILDIKMRKRIEMMTARVKELADVLPRGLEGQAVGIELRKAIAALDAAYRAAVEERAADECQRRLSGLRQSVADCHRWMQLINAARLVQSPRLDELLVEGQGILAVLDSARKSEPAPAAEKRSATAQRSSPPRRATRNASPPPRVARPSASTRAASSARSARAGVAA